MTAAHYFDGRSARLHVVDLSAGDGMVHLRGASTRSYPAAGIRLAEPFAHAPTVLYFNDGTRAEVLDPAMRQLLAEVLGYRKPWAVRWQEHTATALLALVLLVALIASTWFWGLPIAAERLSREVPVSADHALGRNAVALLQKQRVLLPSRMSEDRQASLQGIMQRVLPAAPRIRMHLLEQDAPQLGPNALAFPDGTIVLTDQMVDLVIGKDKELDARAAAALAGILAHEIAHIEMRHSVRSITRSSLTAALSATLFGDFSAVAAGLPALLSNMAYSRDMELVADDYAASALHRRGISTGPLADVFDVLDRQGSKLPKMFRQAMSYASTHPDGYARSRRLIEAAPQGAQQPAAVDK